MVRHITKLGFVVDKLCRGLITDAGRISGACSPLRARWPVCRKQLCDRRIRGRGSFGSSSTSVSPEPAGGFTVYSKTDGGNCGKRVRARLVLLMKLVGTSAA
ncbi:hypothetical protein ACNUDN_00876 [Mycobacterium sp. smrl_JER01]